MKMKHQKQHRQILNINKNLEMGSEVHFNSEHSLPPHPTISRGAGVRCAFTLTEVLLAIAIVGIIAALVLPAVISKFQENGFNQAFERETKTIESAVTGLAVNENKASFFETMMYLSAEPENYENSAEKFLKKYLRVSKICSENSSDCFAKTYYQFKDNDKSVYEPEFKGSCAILKNGASLCITPQIGALPVRGIIDLNGLKGPNILNRDLRTFSFEALTQTGHSTDVAAVLDTDFAPLETDEGYVDPCAGMTCGCGSLPPCPPECPTNPNNWSLSCCQYNSSQITSSTHHCCTYSSIKNSNDKCIDKSVTMTLSCSKYTMKEYKCTYSISGYDTSKYRIFTKLANGISCELNGKKVNCNDYNAYYNSSRRIFSESHATGHSGLSPVGCDIYKNYQLLASYGWSSCMNLTYTYTP